MTCLREIPFGLIQYPLYEWLKKRFAGESLGWKMVCGGVAGGTAAFLTSPIDTVKSRVMTSNQKGLFIVKQTVSEIWNEGGVTGFFKGWYIRVLYITVGGVMFFGSNEFVKKQLGF